MVTIADTVAERRRPADAVLEWIGPAANVVVGAANGEPVTVVDAIEAGADACHGVRLHQMLALHPRRYIDGAFGGLRHVSWFLSPATRQAFHGGVCDLVPNSFSDVPRLLRQSAEPSLVVASVSPPDRHGYFSLGTDAEYAAALIGEVPFFVEVNARMPRTYGGNQLHISDVVGWCEADRPLVEAATPPITDRDRAIAELVAERIPDGATVQAGIGAIPDMVLTELRGHTRARRPHRAPRRRLRRPRRSRRRHRDPQAHAPQQDRDHDRASAASGSTTSSPTTPASSSGRSTTRTTPSSSPASR